MAWHPRQLGEQSGCFFVVTGTNSGIGLEAARGLVERGAHVVLAVRDTAKGEKAAARLAGLTILCIPEARAADQALARLLHDPRRALLGRAVAAREAAQAHDVEGARLEAEATLEGAVVRTRLLDSSTYSDRTVTAPALLTPVMDIVSLNPDAAQRHTRRTHDRRACNRPSARGPDRTRPGPAAFRPAWSAQHALGHA